jgi:capsular polysaccharide transport system permease protein
MTTKPKAKKFRIRRSTSLGRDVNREASAPAPARPQRPTRPEPAQPSLDLGGPVDDGFGDKPFPTAAAKALTQADDGKADSEIADIRKEGLTGRQLRLARRVAQKHGLAPTSDFDAVRLLRRQGIDPFQRSNMLELVVPSRADVNDPEVGVPQTVGKEPQLPSTQVRTDDSRAREIIRMQRDIVKRRRRKLAQLATRVAFVVMLPTLLAG